MNFRCALATLILFNLILPAASLAQGAGSSGRSFTARAEARETNRWTLAEWLEQRDRSRMMDLWLSMNSPSPFEFMLGLSSLSTDLKSEPSNESLSSTSLSGEIHAYAQFVGLTLEHENNTLLRQSDLSGMLNLRIFGNSLQNSSLTIHGGQLTRHQQIEGQNEERKHLFYQATLQLYFSKYFGMEASYRSIQGSNSPLLEREVDGSLQKAGLFIDFKSVRVFGNWYLEKERKKDSASEQAEGSSRSGIQSGFKIYY